MLTRTSFRQEIYHHNMPAFVEYRYDELSTHAAYRTLVSSSPYDRNRRMNPFSTISEGPMDQ
jgi:hypothetical protein